MTSAPHTVDLERLFKLRLVVARHGEMDSASWWNTQGVLGPRGTTVLKRGFPKTHSFTRARIVFEVARSRCREVFHPPGCITLWELDAELEEQFEEHWQQWLDEPEEWNQLIDGLQDLGKRELLDSLAELKLLSPSEVEQVGKLKRSAESRAVALPGVHEVTDETIALLAGGFSRGEKGALAVPYARLAENP